MEDNVLGSEMNFIGVGWRWPRPCTFPGGYAAGWALYIGPTWCSEKDKALKGLMLADPSDAFFSRELPHCPNREISIVFLKKNILQSVRQLFGEEGTKSAIDILKYEPEGHRFVLRCTDDCYVRLRSALTLAEKYEEELCVYRVHRASANLLSFSADSRNYQH